MPAAIAISSNGTAMTPMTGSCTNRPRYRTAVESSTTTTRKAIFTFSALRWLVEDHRHVFEVGEVGEQVDLHVLQEVDVVVVQRGDLADGDVGREQAVLDAARDEEVVDRRL